MVLPRRRTVTRQNEQSCVRPIMQSNGASGGPYLTVEPMPNGGTLGNDAMVMFRQNKSVNVNGIDNHELFSLPVVDATAKALTDKGEVILILCNYAYHGVNRTLHSSGQIEYCQNKVHNGSVKAGGRQVTVTRDGQCVHINVIWGLPCVQMEPNTVEEFDKLPHVVLTQGGDWDPTALDHVLTDCKN